MHAAVVSSADIHSQVTWQDNDLIAVAVGLSIDTTYETASNSSAPPPGTPWPHLADLHYIGLTGRGMYQAGSLVCFTQAPCENITMQGMSASLQLNMC
jgi:hypothetical protein